MGTVAFSTFNTSQLQGCAFPIAAGVPAGPYFAFGASKVRFLSLAQTTGRKGGVEERPVARAPLQVVPLRPWQFGI